MNWVESVGFFVPPLNTSICHHVCFPSSKQALSIVSPLRNSFRAYHERHRQRESHAHSHPAEAKHSRSPHSNTDGKRQVISSVTFVHTRQIETQPLWNWLPNKNCENPFRCSAFRNFFFQLLFVEVGQRSKIKLICSLFCLWSIK